jgi:hypothetical protein
MENWHEIWHFSLNTRYVCVSHTSPCKIIITFKLQSDLISYMYTNEDDAWKCELVPWMRPHIRKYLLRVHCENSKIIISYEYANSTYHCRFLHVQDLKKQYDSVNYSYVASTFRNTTVNANVNFVLFNLWVVILCIGLLVTLWQRDIYVTYIVCTCTTIHWKTNAAMWRYILLALKQSMHGGQCKITLPRSGFSRPQRLYTINEIGDLIRILKRLLMESVE